MELPHMRSELNQFMQQLQHELSSEYKRISARSTEDPGTAGDEGEENWAELLRNWLPSNYHIVTKGRILSHDGEASPQVDILVLHPAYPKHLINKKYYLAGAVLAVFECKLTLRTRHLKKIINTALIIKNLVPERKGSPYKELNQPIVTGVLAHSHEWSTKKEYYALDIMERFQTLQFEGVNHPREMLDVLCIADTAVFRIFKSILVGPNISKEEFTDGMLSDPEIAEGISVGYNCTWQKQETDPFDTILGTLIGDLFTRLAYEDVSIRPMAEYYTLGSLDTGGISKPSLCDVEYLSEKVLHKLRESGTSAGAWSEWKEWQ
jgi:hypothetical protein